MESFKISKEYLTEHVLDLAMEYLEHQDLDKFRADFDELLEESGEGLNE